MNIVMVHGHAFRLRNDGTIESTKAELTGSRILLDEWLVQTPDAVDMSGGDWAEVQTFLERFALLFADGVKRLPSSEPLPSASAVQAGDIR